MTARILHRRHLFPDVPHEKNRAVLREEGCRPGIFDWDRESETALRLIPELPVSIKTKPNLLIVYDHFLQCAHDDLQCVFVAALEPSWSQAVWRSSVRRVGKSVRLGR